MSGARAGAIGPSPICERARCDAATCLYADGSGPIRSWLPVQDGGRGSSDCECDAQLLAALPEVWFEANPDPLGP
jgi:hypothetical protein